MTEVIEFQIPKSSVMIKHNFYNTDNGVETTVSVLVKEKRYERGITLTIEEFEFLIREIAPQILDDVKD